MQSSSDKDLLQAYLDGELPTGELAALQARLRGEPGLADALIQLAREEGIMREWAQANVALHESAGGKPAGQDKQVKKPGSPWRRRLVAAGVLITGAAAAVLIVALASGLFQAPLEEGPILAEVQGQVFLVPPVGQEQPAVAGQRLTIGQRLRTQGDGSFAVVKYLDSSKLEVGADTTIRMEGKSRSSGVQGKRVYLEQGVLSADIVRQPEDHPMVLATPHAEAMFVEETRANFSSVPEETRIEQEKGQIRVIRKSDGTLIYKPKAWFAVAAPMVDGFVPQPLPAQVTEPRFEITAGAGQVLCAAFSPDGSLLATGCQNGAIRIWNPVTGTLQAMLKGHRRARSAAFCTAGPLKGLLLVSGGDEKRLRIIDPKTGKEVQCLRTFRGRIRSVAVSPDGLLVAIGGVTNKDKPEIHVWNTLTKEDRELQGGHTTAILAVAFAPDGKTLATAAWGGTIRLWDTETFTIRQTLTAHKSAVNCLAFSPDGMLLASGSKDRTVKLWDPQTGEERATLQGHVTPVRALAFSPDSRILASADLSVRLWDVATGREKRIFKGHHHAINAVAFSPDGTTLASAGLDRVIRIWDMTEISLEEE